MSGRKPFGKLIDNEVWIRFINEESSHEAVALTNSLFNVLGWSTMELLNGSGCRTWVLLN